MKKPKPCDEPCPKCGSTDIARAFRAKGDKVSNEGYDHCSNRFAAGQCHAYYAIRDHLDNHCRCCTYRWQSLPLPKRSTTNTTKAAAG